MIRNNKQKKIGVLNMISRILPQVASVSPGIFILNSIFFLLSGASFAISILCMQLLFDKVTNLAAHKTELKDAVFALLLLFVVKVLQQIISGVSNFIGETYDAKTTGKFSHIINIKISKLDPVCFENMEILDDINKSYVGIKFARNFINTIMDVIMFYVPYFIFMGIYLFSLKPILTLSILLVFFPVLFAQLIRVKAFAELEDRSASLRRKSKYYENCMVSSEYLKETRTLGACPYFLRLFKETLAHMNRLKWRTEVKINLIELGTKSLSLLGYISILWMLFDALMKHEITVGAFAAVFASTNSMFDMMEEVICGRLGYYAENFGKIRNYLRFLDLPERGKDEDVNESILHGDIVLENVSFSYPLANRKAVKNVSLTIHKGETVALVGENGSGKSTLIRLITGLYLPQSGMVMHNNKSTREFTPKSLFTGISGVFQKYQRYQLSLCNNIIISDIYAESNYKENINSATIKAGIEPNADIFPDGYGTILSREFDGVDLSGGQWQRVAIARGFYRQHELIVLDEPTAAIDPVEETKIYKRFAEIAKNNTAVVVTHRLGSIKFADRIIVMQKGRIVGVGSHEELLSICPLYIKMWESQSQYYTATN